MREINLKLIYETPNDYKDFLETKGPLIYLIKNLVNNKCYVGYTKYNLYVRFFTFGLGSHFSHYEDKDYNVHLYNAMRKYGLDKFTLSILSTDPNDTESKFIKEFDSYHNGYNNNESGLSSMNSAFNKGRVAIHKDDKNKLINKKDLPYYLNNNWVIGYNYSSIKGKIVIHKGVITKRVNKKLLDSYLNKGWELGFGYNPTCTTLSTKLLISIPIDELESIINLKLLNLKEYESCLLIDNMYLIKYEKFSLIIDFDNEYSYEYLDTLSGFTYKISSIISEVKGWYFSNYSEILKYSMIKDLITELKS